MLGEKARPMLSVGVGSESLIPIQAKVIMGHMALVIRFARISPGMASLRVRFSSCRPVNLLTME